MAFQLPPGPLSGPTPTRNRRRNPFWRFRRFLFVIGIVGVVALGGVWAFISQVEELGDDDFDQLFETTYICTGEVDEECGPDVAANEIFRGEDRIIVGYADIPPVLINAVVATEDRTFFEHKGVDPGGLLRAAYRTARQKLSGEGSVQGGSSITQQYVKLVSDDAENSFERKAREIVRAVNLEQNLTEELGSPEAAKQQIIERYLNRAYFGRGAYGVQAASRSYFDKDIANLSLPEAAYLAGLLRNPENGDASERLDEGNRRRYETLRQMYNEGYITEAEWAEADADTWPALIPQQSREGLGEVKGSEYGTEFFVTAVIAQLNELYPDGELFQQGLRVYTTLDPQLQQLAHSTITARLDPNNPDMPLGALVSVNEQGEVVAMMGGADFNENKVNLTMGRAGGGSGFQPGSLMKIFTLAEFVEQGFSPESYFAAPWTIEYPADGEGKCDQWNVRGGVSNRPTVETHRSVYRATTWSMNTVYAQMITQVGAEQSKDMAERLGIVSEMLGCPSDVLGTNVVSPLEITAAYANLAREGERLAPVLIERIEDAQGNVLCWYPTTSCDPNSPSVRVGEQTVDPSVIRQVNGAMVEVVNSGTGRSARLVDEETDVVRPAAGKTGTTQQNRDAWFTGFTCGLTTSVWMGYPGVNGETPRYMNDEVNVENGVELTSMVELFGEQYTSDSGNGRINGGDVPAELWHGFMMAATADDPPCEGLPVEGPSGDQRVVGTELLTTTLLCEQADPALAAASGQPVTTIEGSPPTSRFVGTSPNGRPCTPIDLDGRPITTPTVDPASPSTVDPNNPRPDDDNDNDDDNNNGDNNNNDNNGNGDNNGNDNNNGNGDNDGRGDDDDDD